MNKLKSLLLGFVKPLLLAHLGDLNMLAPTLSAKMLEKGHMTKEQADALSLDLVQVVEAELLVLINKI